MVSDDGTHGIGSIHLQDGTIESTKIGIQVFPESNTTYTGNTAILLDNVAFSHVTSPVIDTNGKSLLSGSDGFQVDVWSVGSQYALGDNYWDGETDIAGATGAQVFSLGSNLKSRRDGDLINDPTSSSFSESWYLYKKKPQYGDADISTFLNAKDYGAKGTYSPWVRIARRIVLALTTVYLKATARQMTRLHSKLCLATVLYPCTTSYHLV